MKFTGLDSTSYGVRVGSLRTAGDVKDDTIKFLTMIDGTVEIINYGARKASEAEFKIINLTNTQFYTLTDYLIANAGEKVLLTLENEAEVLFPLYAFDDYTEYYVYILGSKNLQEEAITCSKNLFTLTVKVALAGLTSDAVPNPADESIIDVLIEIDTTAGAIKQSTGPVVTDAGERWLDTDNNKLYKWDGYDWILLYTVAADDSDYGFYQGSFYLAAFSDTTYSGNTYKSGLINRNSIKVPGQSINIQKGPSIARREGYSFSLKDVDDVSVSFWKFVIDNSLNIYGAKCTQKILKAGTETKFLTGRNLTNKFDYVNYVFNVEPYSLNSENTFPNTVIDNSNSRYTDVRTDVLGKAPFVTFGQFDGFVTKNNNIIERLAALQNISTDRRILEVDQSFPSSSTISSQKNTVIYCKINRLETTEIYIKKITSGTLFSYQTLDSSLVGHVIECLADTKVSSSNPGEVREITAFDNSDPTWTILTIDEAFPTDPDDATGATAPDTDDQITVRVIIQTLRYQIDENAIGGFGALLEDETFSDEIKLYQLSENQKQLEQVPADKFDISESDGYITIDPKLAANPDKTVTYNEITSTDGVLPIDGDKVNKPISLGFSYTETSDFDNDTPNVDIDPPTIYEDDFMISHEGPNTSDPIYPFVYTAYTSALKPVCWIHKHTTQIYQQNKTQFIRFNLVNFGSFGDVMLEPNTAVVAYSFPRVAIDTDNDFKNSDNVRLVCDLLVSSRMRSNEWAQNNSRLTSAPFKFLIRFKKFDGNYICNANWELSFGAKELGLNANNADAGGKVAIKNTQSTSGRFADDINTLDEYYDEIITYIFVDRAARNANTTRQKGDYAWIEDVDEIDECTDFNAVGAAAWTDNSISYNIGDKLYYNTGNVATAKLYEVVAGPALSDITSTIGDGFQTKEGKDLFNLTDDLFDSALADWIEIESMEVLIINDNLENQFNATTENMDVTTDVAFRDWIVRLSIVSPFRLYEEEQLSLSDKQLFTSAQGQSSGFTFPTLAEPIVSNIMDVIYANKYSSASLTSLVEGARSEWKWKKQFTTAKKANIVLKDLLWNLWACAVINSDDSIEFKPLNTDSITANTLTLTDSNVIQDSISAVKFRKSNEIYQQFDLQFDKNTVNEYSNFFEGYNDGVTISETVGDVSLRTLINKSKTLFNLDNKFKKEFDYHYINLTNISEWVVKHFAFNSWEFSCKVSLTTILNPSQITIMDSVSFTSYFHSSNETFYGFITGIKPDFYNGMAKLTIYVPDPLGKFGPLCDPFNDALNISTRDVTSWTDANGKRNDAAQISTRTIGDFTQKNAGQISTRTFDCN